MSEKDCPYLVGVAEVDVTPAVGSLLAGFAARVGPSTGVYLPLRAIVTAITEKATDHTVIIVSLEWLGFYDNTANVRAQIEALTGVAADNILLCGTHTHCGPPMRKFVDGEHREGIDEAYLKTTFENIAATAKRAMDSREPRLLASTVGWCGLARSRRRPDGKGGVTWNPSLDAPHDHTVPLLRFTDEQGTLRHVLFGYTAHTSSAGMIYEYGAFLQGCAGDQKAYLAKEEEGFPKYSIDEVHEMGRQLARAVEREIKFGRWQDVQGELAAQSQEIELQLTVLPREEYASWLDSENKFFARWARAHVEMLDRGEQPDTAIQFELQTVCFGDSLVLLTMAGEMSAEYGLRAMKEFGSRFGQVWPVGYANSMVGYVCSERQLPEGGYEVLSNMQGIMKPGPYESGTEEKIFSGARQMLAT